MPAMRKKVYILITIENSRFLAAMYGCDCKLRLYSREFTTIKGMILHGVL